MEADRRKLYDEKRKLTRYWSASASSSENNGKKREKPRHRARFLLFA